MINGKSVQVGHFKSQGNHSDAKMPYPDLMAIHHFGLNKAQPRMLLTLLKLTVNRLNDSKYSTLMNAFGKTNYTTSDVEGLLDGFGRTIAAEEKKLFGVISMPNMPPTESPKKIGVMGEGAPLVDTGELKSKVAYKTSISNKVVEG